jgi:hypothetical protein
MASSTSVYSNVLLASDPVDLFAPAEDDWLVEGCLAQMKWMPARGHEGVLFGRVGRRDG